MNSQPERYIQENALDDLKEKMIFVGGPRQVGKTTFALSVLSKLVRGEVTKNHPAYLNWDILQHRKEIRQAAIAPNQPLIVLDEVHKYPRWRNLMKGLFDQYAPKISFLVTGSARLDYYSKGGDSLMGRYHYYRLHPFSLRELNKTPSAQDVSLLLRFGGFPEPLFRGSETAWRRWQEERIHQVLQEDVRDLERVREIGLLDLLVDALPERIGSPLSIQALREDLVVDHKTVENWLRILERLYVCFRIAPFGSPKIRAVKKSNKLYLWDWSMAPEGGPRFENLVASQLLKYCHFLQDTQGYRMELRFIRDTDLREVDFVVLQNKKPLFAVECKSGEKEVSPALRYFRQRTNIPRFFQVHLGTRDYGDDEVDVRVLPFHKFCSELRLP